MKSFTTLKNLYGSLSTNASTTNLTLGGQLINDQQRYLLQKYFDNERSAQTTTVGGQSLTLTGSLSANATTATLTASWSYPTCTQLVNFSNSNQRSVLFTNGSTAISWTGGLTATATTAITTVGVQDYLIPADVSKIKDDTITVGQLRYSVREVKTRLEWDIINTLPYTSDIPNYYFIWNGRLGVFPIPSTTGNILTFNYKSRVADLTYADYSVGNIASSGMTVGSTAVTGTSTIWTVYPQNVDLSAANLMLRADPPNGDGIWYPISRFTSATTLVLQTPVVNAPNITGSTTYTIGQFPILSEDFHDMLVHGALTTYFSSVKTDKDAFKQFATLYEQRLELLAQYAGTKSVTVDLGGPIQQENGNLYLYANTGS